MYQRDVYLEILGEAGYSPWDARHEILLGDLLNPPVITKEVLFTPVNALREEFHAPEPLGTAHVKPILQDFIVSTPSLGSHKLDLAKEALLKRGFSYLRQEDNFHHWCQQISENAETDVLLWERDGIVWIRASTSAIELPTQDTPITDVWDDTGILTTDPGNGVASVREDTCGPGGKTQSVSNKTSFSSTAKARRHPEDLRGTRKRMSIRYRVSLNRISALLDLWFPRRGQGVTMKWNRIF